VFEGVFGRNVSRETFLSSAPEMAASNNCALARCANIELICAVVAALNWGRIKSYGPKRAFALRVSQTNVSRETSLLCQFSSVERNAKGCPQEPVRKLLRIMKASSAKCIRTRSRIEFPVRRAAVPALFSRSRHTQRHSLVSAAADARASMAGTAARPTICPTPYPVGCQNILKDRPYLCWTCGVAVEYYTPQGIEVREIWDIPLKKRPSC
jgi:hypothetical protein